MSVTTTTTNQYLNNSSQKSPQKIDNSNGNKTTSVTLSDDLITILEESLSELTDDILNELQTLANNENKQNNDLNNNFSTEENKRYRPQQQLQRQQFTADVTQAIISEYYNGSNCIELYLNGWYYRGFVDTGTPVTCLGFGCIDFIQRNGLDIYPTYETYIRTANGQINDIVGSVRLNVTCNGQMKMMTVFLVPSLKIRISIGLDLIEMFNIRASQYLQIFYVFYHPADSGAVSLTSENIDMTLASNELVFLNFYAEWCRFSNLLAPIFNEAADKVREAFPDPGKVVLGKVDCDKETAIASRFHITKYPTLKIVRNGQLSKREYRGQRSAEAFLEFVKKQLEDPIKEFHSLKDLETLDSKKRIIIGYFDRRDQPEYDTFRKVASNLKDECQFHVGFGEAAQAMHPPGGENKPLGNAILNITLGHPIIVFRPDVALTHENDETYTGSLKNFDELKIWIQEKCVPLVREITFENAEELTEEGLPFLILFHHPDDTNSIKDYKAIIEQQLMDEKQNVNFLTADGKRFAHPLHHLGKSEEDLPIIAIDSFRHMYLFPNFKDMYQPGKLKQFLQDLYNGKLHREFHYGPDPVTNEIQADVNSNTSPPESTFKKLGPSKNRYTLLTKDEL
ncbi:endoplasmic reticulum resident protein 44-like [Musca vetustissima]|uniref:endoplasmic reticulum resident protein 44-like n=2 Tax=Musca vetustissima TaxID=27455 RepID=UPI002AB665FD|nr:endoplasmic reticulum resident protein 44-like [Musca vetustissima]